jgi:hypothetical protein
MAKGLNYERRMMLANRFSKPAPKPAPKPIPKAMSYNRFGVPKEDREVDTPTKIFGEAVKFLLPSPSMIKQAVQDPSGTIRGGAELVSLGNPVANTMRAINLLQGEGFSLYGADMSDVEQFVELASLYPGGKAVSVPLKAGAKLLDVGIKGAARRTTPDILSAASGGLLRGGPVSAARKAPEPDEFDKIINTAKAEDPTLGNVVPEDTPTSVFRSELDWDPEMSVNYKKAREKITMDLLSRQRGADGEDPTLIIPLIEDSIAALDDEIGNLSIRNYNHNDLEDFLGKISDPDEYTLADSTLAKRADELVNSIDDDAVVWGVDPEAWLRETGRSGNVDDVRGLLEGLDMGASSLVNEAEGILRGTTRLPRQGSAGAPSRGPSPSSTNPRAPRGGSSGAPIDPITGNYMPQPNERRFASGASVLARAESQSLSSQAADKATQTAINRLKRQLGRELNIREVQIIRSKAKESGPEFYTAYQDFASHPDNYDRIVKVAAENERKIKALDEEIASVSSRKAKKLREALKTEEITRQNAEFAQAHDPSKGLKDNAEQILTGKTSAVGGIQITSKNANDLDNAASLRYDKLFKSGDPIINTEFPNGKPDSWAKIVDWGIKNSPRYTKYLSVPDGLKQMQYDLYLTHLI